MTSFAAAPSPVADAAMRHDVAAVRALVAQKADLGNMLAELRRERDQITEAIMSLERMAIGHQRRRGRPPAWMVTAREATPAKRRGRPPGSKNTARRS
jgi:hypothetical protein